MIQENARPGLPFKRKERQKFPAFFAQKRRGKIYIPTKTEKMSNSLLTKERTSCTIQSENKIVQQSRAAKKNAKLKENHHERRKGTSQRRV